MSSKKAPPPSLKPADRKLWEQVTETVHPLKGRPDGKPLPARRRVERLDEGHSLPSEWHSVPAPAPDSWIDRRTRRQISVGAKNIDRSIDLHGMTQDQAYTKLVALVHAAIKRGDKLLLVVTGKGGKRFSQLNPDTPAAYRRREDFEQMGGVLKRVVPAWLEGSDLKPFIQSYGPAAQEHGGEGALYIMLRKRLPGSRKTEGKP
ncbi:Smr/MutS family protein [Kordiimonas pumila]|uniref:Smr/MutS family protein n=1 Tax=Kordiimonas pumila TaxID=2161677 RepID=A0ABV7D9Q2_9PROT|nr:Smr/MutS family protein [Kordiimonas pumila]